MADAISIGVAFVALAVSVWNAFRTHSHNHLSVRPLLALDCDFEGLDSGRIGVVLCNQGFGPAVISSSDLYLDGVQLPRDPGPWNNLLHSERLGHFSAVSLPSGTVIAPSERLWLVFVRRGKVGGDRIRRFYDTMGRLEIRISYRSISGEAQPEFRECLNPEINPDSDILQNSSPAV